MKVLFLFLLCFASFFVQAQSTEPEKLSPLNEQLNADAGFEQILNKFSADIQQTIAVWNLPSLAIVIVKDGHIVLNRAYGYANPDKKIKANSDTAYQMASVSKTFASTILVMLAQEGLLDLNAPIKKYLPRLILGTPEHTKKIKVKDILSQTTGFAAHSFDNKLSGHESYLQIIAQLKNLKIKHAPGTHHDYQNIIYSLAGKIAEAVTHKPYEQLVKEKIFNPLGMTHSSIGASDFLKVVNKAQSHQYQRGVHYPRATSTSFYKVNPAAGINSTANDMAQWLKLQMGYYPQFLSDASRDLLHSPLILTPSETARASLYRERIRQSYYGLGFRIYDYAGHKHVLHTGMLAGTKSLIEFDAQRGVGLVMFMNSTSPALSILRNYFFDKYYGLNFVDWNSQIKNKEKVAPKRKSKKKPVKKKTVKKK